MQNKTVLARLKDYLFAAKEATVYDLQIVFHKEAADRVAHGIVIATSREHKLVKHPVRFAFVGISHAPVLTPDVIYHIWSEAERQGFVLESLQTYKTLQA